MADLILGVGNHLMAKGKQRVHQTPRISVNKLGEYVVSKAGRQNRILRDQKFPSEYIVAYYKPAQEAISSFLAGKMEDFTRLENAVESLNQQPATTVWETRRAASNVDALETFMNMLDDIDFKDAEPKLGSQSGAGLTLRNVEISVRPEVLLTGNGKGGTELVGGIKLHFPRSFPLTKDAAGYISAAVQMYSRDVLYAEGQPYGPYCMVLDMASQTVWPGVRATKQREIDIESACVQIAALWASVTQ